MDCNTNKQASATARVERLPWINDLVRRLEGAAAENGRRLLKPRDLLLLAHLELHHPQGEAVLAHAQIREWAGSKSDDTPGEILTRLRKEGVIEYRPAGEGEAWLASLRAPQSELPLEPGASESVIHLMNHRSDSSHESTIHLVNRSSPPPHPHPGAGASGMYTTPHDTARARAHARGPSASDGGSSSGSASEWLDLVGEARRRRRELVGVERVSDREYPKLRRLQQLGGTAADLDDALDEFRLRIEQKRAFLSGGSFGLVLDLAIDAASAREETRYADQRTANDGRGDPPGTGGLARAPRPAGIARGANGRAGSAQRAVPRAREAGTPRPSPISDEEERERERRNAEFVRKHLGAVARD